MSFLAAALVLSVLTGSNDLASSISLPDGPGSVRGLADRPEVEAFTGQAHYALPIALPHGPAGFGTSLTLSYQGDHGNGPLGLGWSLGTVSIERSLEHGVPTYTDADELYLRGPGNGRLVPVGPGEYRVEGQGNHLRVQAQGGGFVVTDSRGTRYVCGSAETARVAGPLGVAQWHVETVTNLAGQQVRFDYARDGNALYLSDATWGNTGEFAVHLSYVQRADVLQNFRRGFGLQYGLLLDHLDKTVGGALLRRYVLVYDTSLPVSRLVQVTQLGRDGATALPTLTFGYAPAMPAQAFSMGSTGSWDLGHASAALMDLDGDGYADLLDMTRGAQKSFRNLGSSFADPQALSVPDAPASSVRFIDTQGDAIGRLAVVQNGNWNLYTFAGTSAQLAAGPMAGTAGQPLSSAMEAGATTCDLNGDGRTDLLRRLDANTVQVRYGTGVGLADANPGTPPADGHEFASIPGGHRSG